MADVITLIVDAVTLYLVNRIVDIVVPYLVDKVAPAWVAPILVGLFVAVSPCLLDPIGREMFNYHSNIKKLSEEVNELQRVRQPINAAWTNADEIQPDVKEWLTSVDGIIENALKFLEDEKKENEGFFNRLCAWLYWKSWYQKSKTAKQTAAEIATKIREGNRLPSSAPPQTIRFTPVEGYEAFESRTPILKKIMEALRNANVNLIGVYGMGGTGKTTLVKEIARKCKEVKLFDKVVMATVSQSPNIREIQGEISDMLNLELKKDSKFGRADLLYDELKKLLMKNKSILVILDDIWKKLDLAEVGIPFGDDYKGCKIVVTSRSQDVLSNELGTQQNFSIGVLLEEEAWDLFKKTAGDRIEDPELKTIATEIVQECAGLPLAVKAVANALKNRNRSIWKNALEQLKSSTPVDIVGIDKEVYSSLKLSYDFLQNDDARSLFLLCCLHPEDHNISIHYLLIYGKGLGLFRGTLEQARDRAHALVAHLKGSSLLLDGNTTESVRVHDVVRDVGISIASKDKNMLIVRNEDRLEECATEERLRNCPAISLPYSNIQELPKELECPELKFLLLLSKDHSLAISDNFFEGMKQLKVLNLTNIHFSSLPSSLYLLSNLQTLCLDQCRLRDIARIGELTKLEVLSFASSNIEELPREIGQLTHLRMLDLRNCSKLKVIPPNVIAGFSRLEDLHMEESFVGWGVNGNASLSELEHLSSLVTLDIHIRDAMILPKDLSFEKLLRYRIFIGDGWDWSGGYKTTRTLKLKPITRIQQESGIQSLLKGTEDLYLEELKDMRSVLYDLDGEGFPHLKHLHIQKGCEIEYVINTMEWSPNKAFPNLESLFLSNLIKLKEICQGQIPLECFSNLKSVNVASCGGLKNLFPLSLARRLSQLQELEIEECRSMDEIVGEGREGSEGNNEAMDKLIFPQLRLFRLDNLPKLTSFYSKGMTRPSLNYTPTIDAGSGEIISGGEHDIPIPLFNEKVAFPNLEELSILYVNSLKKIWPSQLPVDNHSFCNLKSFNVLNCEHLLNIIPSNMLMRLQNMERLSVSDCGGSLEYIFDLGGLNDKEMHVELRDLYLQDLPGLKQIWKKDPHTNFLCQNLSSLNVNECGNLRSIFTTSMVKSLKQLQNLYIRGCEMVEEIVEEEGVEEQATHKIVFPQLTSLTLLNLPLLKSFCQRSHILEWPSSKKLDVCESDNVEIFALESSSFEEMRGKDHLGTPTKQPMFLVDKVAFPKLEELSIRYVNSMKEIWPSQLPVDNHSFCNLKSFDVENCEHLLNIIPSNMLMRLQNMESLTVCRCGGSLEYIFDLGGLNDKEMDVELRDLHLGNLPGLKQIWKKDPQTNFLCQKLSSLEVYECGNLRSIFTTSMVKSLKQLQNLYIRGCEMVEEIVEEEGVEEQATHKIVFPQLTSLTLLNLPLLKSFCQRSHILEWPSSKKLDVCESDNVEIFALESSSFEEMRGKDHLGTPTKQPVFLVDKVAFPNLEELVIYNVNYLKEIWPSQLPVDNHSFCNLKSFIVRDCEHLLNIIPSNMLMRLQNMERLTVCRCGGSLEYIFDLGGLNDKEMDVELRDLHLGNLPGLKQIWKKDPQTNFLCQKLSSLEVYECGNLRSIFTTSMVKSLKQLQNLSIRWCEMVEEIVEEEGVEEQATHKIVFPQLTSLILGNLPLLKSFCQRSHILEWPSSKKLDVCESDNVEIFALESSSFEEMRGKDHLGTPTKQPVFLVDKVAFPNLEELSIRYVNSLKEIWPSQLSVDNHSFCNLKSFRVEGCEHPLNIIPSNMLMRLRNLESLEVVQCNDSVEYIFDVGELNDMERHVLRSIPLRELRLQYCRRLKQIWKTDSRLSAYFSFQNLTSLKVTYCFELRHIFTTSIAKSLVQLQELEIGRSQNVEEIVGNEGVEEESMGKIEFPRLTSLTLKGLPQLKSFYQGILKVEAFSLKSSSVEESHGKGHVGTPTKPLFLVDKVVFPNLEELKLEYMSRMKEIWQDQYYAASFGKLRVLEVCNCESLTHVLTFAIAKSLVQIKSIIVDNCKMMKVVIASEGEETDETTFSQLNSLKLRNLPNLTSFCARTKTFSFPSLVQVLVEKCPELKTFSYGILHTPKLDEALEQSNKESDKGFWKGGLNSTIQYLFKQKVEFLRLSELSELKQICYDQFPIDACYVQYLVVEKCTSLLNVVSSVILEGLQNLKKITVESCDSLEQVFDLEGLDCDEERDELLPNLEEMNLTELPKLRCLWNKDPKGILSFQSLRWLNIHKCNNLRNLFSPMIPDLYGLEGLKITDCLNMKEIVEKEKEAKEEAIDEIKFDLLYIILQGLPNLTSFYPGNHTLVFPYLETMKIAECPRIKTFTSTNEGLQETFGDGNVDVPSAPLFINNKVEFPELEELELEDLYSIKEIWQGQLHTESFCNLTTLTVCSCQNLTHLLPFAIAKRLVQIKSIIVGGCEMMKEIIAKEEGEEADHETTFIQLSSLKLRSLPNLTNFYTRSNTFSFPSLEQVLVEECPKLKIFSNGILNTPKLEKVQVQEDEWVWKDNLNTTIQHLFAQKGDHL